MNEPPFDADADPRPDDLRGAEPVAENDAVTGGPVDAVVEEQLDFDEGLGPPPTLDGLGPDDRREAEALIDAMTAGRGIDPYTSTPSLEELLAGTELEAWLEQSSTGGTVVPLDGDTASVTYGSVWTGHAELIAEQVRAVDPRVAARVELHDLAGPAVTVTYLDLRVVLVPVTGTEPDVTTAENLGLANEMFDTEDDLEYIGVVATGSDALLTEIFSCSDLKATVVAPSDLDSPRRPPTLPLRDAFRRMMDLAAPLWEPYEFVIEPREALDLSDIATRLAQQVVERETGRRYHGEKGRAYKSFGGAASAFADLVVQVGVGTVDEESIDEAVDRIARDAA